MSRTSRWIALLAFPLVAALGACTEDLQTGGTCPVLCPGQDIVIRDTVLEGIIVLDTNLVGFPFQGSEDPLVLAAWTDTLDIRVVARFDSLTRQFQQVNGDAPSEILKLDSAYVTLRLSATEIATPPQWFIDVYDVFEPTVVDTLPLQSIPLFTPSRLVGTYQGDTAFTDTLRIRIPIDTTYLRQVLATPDRRVRLGFQVRAAQRVQLRVAPTDLGSGPTLAYVAAAVDTVPEPDTIVRTRFSNPGNSLTPAVPPALAADLTDYHIVVQAPSKLAPNTMTVGGLPGSRVYLRFALPAWVTDSVGVLRAQLQLVQDPVSGVAADDSVRLDGHLVVANSGVLSLHRAATLLSPAGVFLASKWITPSRSDTVRLNVNNLLRQWNTANPARAEPTALILRSNLEGGTAAALRFHSTAATDPGLRPKLLLTYTPGSVLGQP
ncbi:hypothetical protein Strain138_001301 [Pseudogemmatithrix spongiicola]|uniref:DUF4382 domain-containing protein n=1 Tax=Pseudogemmatithrix spongiicola TaxID=3062599 RepID=A0AA49Q6U6_9BACT|nr:hypothetical protein Strain138_001301 [Gemmatimonadaceae bacterium 'strain 138']WKW14938.1 hypothetical protein Strain318_001301 [Gemmatimonadaceae bacterium 'strain 318']